MTEQGAAGLIAAVGRRGGGTGFWYIYGQMGLRTDRLPARLDALDQEVRSLRLVGAYAEAARRFSAGAAAARFHLADRRGAMIVAVLGGTGAGKSTLVNRLLGREVSAASFRRTFTSGPVAIPPPGENLPEGWAGMAREEADATGAAIRGKAWVVTVVKVPPNTAAVAQEANLACQDHAPILVDTPDLDGDQPLHHDQADRIFRWADAVIFLVSPEKYQMTELEPYYRMARRYEVPSLYVMNKAESGEMVEDYLRQRGAATAYAIPRDDAAYEPDSASNLAALRTAIAGLEPLDEATRLRGNRNRLADLAGRFMDEIIAPMRRDRERADALLAALAAMQSLPIGVDVNPITQQLRQRLRRRSVLYLIGPQRVLDRLRQTPMLLARLPKTTWDVLIRGKMPTLEEPRTPETDENVPDFPQLLCDQFTQLLSRIEDTVRSDEDGKRWIEADEAGWKQSKIDPAEAGKIAQEELAELKQWLERKWNATPRDTRLLQTLVRRLPGGAKLLKWTEASPYLLAIVLAAHGALFGHVDLAVLGGYSLVAWIMERLSNEVAARTRGANTRIERRFTDLAERQIRQSAAWVNERIPSRAALKQLEHLTTDLADAAGAAP